MEHQIDVAYQQALDAKTLATRLAFSGLVLAGALGLMLKRSIVGPVNRVKDTARELADNVLPRLSEVASAVGKVISPGRPILSSLRPR